MIGILISERPESNQDNFENQGRQERVVGAAIGVAVFGDEIGWQKVPGVSACTAAAAASSSRSWGPLLLPLREPQSTIMGGAFAPGHSTTVQVPAPIGR